VPRAATLLHPEVEILPQVLGGARYVVTMPHPNGIPLRFQPERNHN
jgi:hypothetical protein